MSETYFSKLDSKEKESRLVQLGISKGQVTVWVKGSQKKFHYSVLEFDKARLEIILNNKENMFSKGTQLLCSFELRGMFFFSEVTVNKSIVDFFILEFKGQLFKSEKRSSYRLLTFPIYNVNAEFDLGEAYEGGKVVDIKNRNSQTTGLFKNFLSLIEAPEEVDGVVKDVTQTQKFRVQDLSATGLSLHISELEAGYFAKGILFKNVKVIFPDETIIVPEVKVVYLVDFIAAERKIKKYKVGLNFPNNPVTIDENLGLKINELLREIDFNKDFENFTK
jgi:hypothetical protein